MIFKVPIWLLGFAAATLLSCAQTVPLAWIEATIVPEGDTLGTSSVEANINFTSFSQPPGPQGADNKLRMSFTNDAGDLLYFQLSPVSGSFPANGHEYDIDGQTNQFEGRFSVYLGSGQTDVQVTSQVGFLRVHSISLDADGFLVSISAEFIVNFDTGGAGEGQLAL